MISAPRPVHYLRQNHDTWTPAAVIFLDSETRTVDDGRREIEVLQCWDAQHIFRRHRRRQGEISRAAGLDRTSAAEQIDAWASMDKSTWFYAHNIGFDLITTDLPAQLAGLGWELSSRHAVSGASPWLILHKGRQDYLERPGRGRSGPVQRRVKWQHTLTLTDSYSLMPIGLGDLADHAPVAKPPLPRQDDGLAVWQARCRADVDILAWAVLTLMDWWEREQLGKWAISGAAGGWNTYRHQLDYGSVVIDPDPDRLAFGHSAVYGGRRDAFRVGQLPPGRYSELDFTAAYPAIAAAELLPCKTVGPLTPQIARAILAGKARYGMLAEVEIKTDVARWPVRALGRVFYPVGHFRTVLAGPEIAEAQRLGCLLDVGRGYFYWMSDHMAPWACWVRSLQTLPDDQVPYPARVFGKAISRSVCGKWAQRGFSTEPYPGPPGVRWTYEDCWIAGTDARASICGLGGQHFLSIADQDSEQEFPAILAYIESHVRARLNRVIDAAPPGAVIQCDTDGVMVSLNALEQGLADRLPHLAGPGYRGQLVGLQMRSWQTVAAPLELREKHGFERAEVFGPQHVVLDGRPRFSGVPRSAWQTAGGRWVAQLWPSMVWQLREGDPSGYVRPFQDYLIVGPYAAGWTLDDGAVRPVEAALDADGRNYIKTWAASRWLAAGDRLGPSQADWADALTERIEDDPTH